MEGLRVRSADFEIGDLDDLEKLHAKLFPSDLMPEWELGDWVIATHAGDPFGFVGVESHWAARGPAYLSRVGVLPRYAGNGFGRMLVKRAMSKARSLGPEMWTDTRKNPASANTLIACGFRQFAPPTPWAFQDSDYWRVKL